MQTKKLKIIPLGGLGEFGMNCLALRWEDDIIVIDAGLMFPESELLGVDIVVPDITYLIENKQHVRGIVLTHGHQDHIGGLPWILSELKVPVYATEFTLAYVEGNLEEHHLLDETTLIEITPKQKFTIGPFTIEPIHVTHSLVDAVALAIETPVGVIIHSGDFKIDLSPLDGKSFDLQTFAEYGKRGVLALLQDSTNVERHGYTPSERAVIPRLNEIFSQTKKKLFFSCFSSSIYRMKIAFDLAHQYGRKVAIIGRSMMESTEIAQDLGYIDVPKGLIINPGQMRDYSPEQLMILISGTQGEPMSALSRAAVDNHKHAHIDAGDTVVLSSRVIPGNEKSIYQVIDHLFRREANVIYDDGTNGLIHVSGHGSQEEMRLLINLVRPKYFIPVHGNYRYLRKHAQIALETGAVEHALVIEDGDVLELDKHDVRKKDKVTAGRILIDSGSSQDPERRRRGTGGSGHQQAHRQDGAGAGSGDARLWRRGHHRPGARSGAEDAGRADQRAAVRLRHGEGEGAGRAEAPDPEDHRAAADGDAHHHGNLIQAERLLWKGTGASLSPFAVCMMRIRY
jgi:ribonuclease J